MTTAQRLHRIAQIFDEVNRTCFDGVIPAPKFILNTRMTHTSGAVCYDTWTLEISPAYHDHHGWDDELVDTIKHEAIHLYLASRGRPSGHTKEFKAISQRIGTSIRGKAMPRRRPHYRYLVLCPQCGTRQSLGSWKTGLACGPCCTSYNQGRYTPEFRLTLIERVTMPVLGA